MVRLQAILRRVTNRDVCPHGCHSIWYTMVYQRQTFRALFYRKIFSTCSRVGRKVSLVLIAFVVYLVHNPA
jgi:hypothetical protein